MPAVLVALMVLVILLVALGALLLFSKLVRAEADRVRSARLATERDS
jgi:hypothetical protein